MKTFCCKAAFICLGIAFIAVAVGAVCLGIACFKCPPNSSEYLVLDGNDSDNKILSTEAHFAKNISIIYDVKAIQPRCFSNNDVLENIEFYCDGKDLKIGENAFEKCKNLKTVLIKAKNLTIDTCAFSNCTALERVTVCAESFSVGKECFLGCKNLNAVEGSLSAAYDFCFGDCKKLKFLCFELELNKEFGNDILLSCSNVTVKLKKNLPNNFSKMFKNANGLNVVVAEGIDKIPEGYFSGCSFIKSVRLPASVKEIGRNAFSGCSSLSKIDFSGTKAQWKEIKCEEGWRTELPATKVICSDDEVELKDS